MANTEYENFDGGNAANTINDSDNSTNENIQVDNELARGLPSLEGNPNPSNHFNLDSILAVVPNLSAVIEKIQNKLQLSGFIVLIIGVITMIFVPADKFTGAIAVGAVGVTFILFPLLLNNEFIERIPKGERSKLILSLFFGFLLFVAALVIFATVVAVFPASVKAASIANYQEVKTKNACESLNERENELITAKKEAEEKFSSEKDSEKKAKLTTVLKSLTNAIQKTKDTEDLIHVKTPNMIQKIKDGDTTGLQERDDINQRLIEESEIRKQASREAKEIGLHTIIFEHNYLMRGNFNEKQKFIAFGNKFRITKNFKIKIDFPKPKDSDLFKGTLKQVNLNKTENSDNGKEISVTPCLINSEIVSQP
jgi:hypothetical protein